MYKIKVLGGLQHRESDGDGGFSIVLFLLCLLELFYFLRILCLPFHGTFDPVKESNVTLREDLTNVALVNDDLDLCQMLVLEIRSGGTQ